jgi:hypothetical protein
MNTRKRSIEEVMEECMNTPSHYEIDGEADQPYGLSDGSVKWG